MPSPFPGMDPYLENVRLWADVHLELISGIRALLNPQLLPKYYVRVEERIYVADESDPARTVVIPDLRVAKGYGERIKAPSGLQVAEAIEVTLLDAEIHEPRLEIIDAERRQVITVIEILSPTNKMSGSAGRKSYLDKRNEVMASSTHLVEIDLLRDGKGFIARERFPKADYFVFLSRTDSERRRNFVWPIDLAQKLPVVEIPLRERDEDAHLDLQACIEQVYDRGAYQMAIDYKTQPVPALSEQRDAWADQLLRGSRMR
jgi:hypothetical protein